MEGFSDATARWCSLASSLLGWRPNEFWEATPCELIAALSDPSQNNDSTPPSRELITQLMERDKNE